MTERLHFHFSLSCIEGNGNPLQCSCLENPRDGGAWWAAVYGVAQSQTRLKWLSSSSLFYGPDLTSVHDYWKNHSFDYMDLCAKVMSRFKKKKIKKTIYLFYLFGCAMQHMDSSSLTRDWTHTPCIGSSESQPLTCQGSVMSLVFNMLFRFVIAFLSRSNCLYKVAFLKNTKQNLLKILRLLKFLFLDKLYS